MALVFPLPSRAEATTPEVTEMRLERSEEGVFLSANVRFELPPLVEDALLKGIPMFFVAEAELYRDRWYWYDKKLADTARHMRLAYQPLTRRWRLNVSPTPIGNAGLGVTLTQNFDSLTDALAAIQRFSRWKIAPAWAVEADSKHNVDFRFRLDVSQLPRPFQIGAVGQSDWSLSAIKNQRLPVEAAK
ncbi:MAG TPA: DUF4390 domain-containing protein [Burkholderiaceae bacterium]|nr:DUF4390 domain-containing protein [Burkholderiaceae bacterium]